MVNIWSLMETNRLRQFKVFVEVKHLRRAAEILTLSHAGLYKSLRQLERELGRSLFYSQGKRLEITKEGMLLYDKILPLLLSVDALTQSETTPSHEKILTIGTFEVFSTHLISEVLSDKKWELMRVRVLELIPGELERAISYERVDLGVTYLPIPTGGVEFYRVGAIAMGVYCRRGAFPKLNPLDLPFVVPVRPIEGTPTGVRGLDGWPENLFPRKVAFEVDLMETALEIVRTGKAAAFLPEPVVVRHNAKHRSDFFLEQRFLPQKFPQVKRNVFVLKKANRPEEAEEKRLAAVLRKICS